jgi:hypothetical protein
MGTLSVIFTGLCALSIYTNQADHKDEARIRCPMHAGHAMRLTLPIGARVEKWPSAYHSDLMAQQGHDPDGYQLATLDVHGGLEFDIDPKPAGGVTTTNLNYLLSLTDIQGTFTQYASFWEFPRVMLGGRLEAVNSIGRTCQVPDGPGKFKNKDPYESVRWAVDGATSVTVRWYPHPGAMTKAELKLKVHPIAGLKLVFSNDTGLIMDGAEPAPGSEFEHWLAVPGLWRNYSPYRYPVLPWCGNQTSRPICNILYEG